MRVLAIDPGYERMGAAVVEKPAGREVLIFSDCLITSRDLPFSERLLSLGISFEKLIKEYQPDTVALEKLFFTTNQKTASAVSEVRGMLLYLSAKHQIPIVEYTPLEIKSTITGFGKANKEQIIAMVKQLIKLEKAPKYDDEYDAIAAGLTAMARIKFS